MDFIRTFDGLVIAVVSLARLMDNLGKKHVDFLLRLKSDVLLYKAHTHLHSNLRTLATNAIASSTTRVSYFYKIHVEANGTTWITDVTFYILDFKNSFFIVADSNT